MNHPPRAFADHDHTRCARAGMAAAEAHCKARGLRLTPLRARVLELLLEEHRALGAYEVLDRLRADGIASQPPTAYRALDFLVEHGFAHRIEKLNGYLACLRAGDSAGNHRACFLICERCRRVVELIDEGAIDALEQAAAACGFVVRGTVLELIGQCPNCATPSEPPA